MSDDEQGYAPASYLEPVEDTGADDVHPEDQTNQGGCGYRVHGGVYFVR